MKTAYGDGFIPAKKGNDTEIVCTYNGSPDPQLEWFFNGYKLNVRVLPYQSPLFVLVPRGTIQGSGTDLPEGEGFHKGYASPVQHQRRQLRRLRLPRFQPAGLRAGGRTCQRYVILKGFTIEVSVLGTIEMRSCVKTGYIIQTLF